MKVSGDHREKRIPQAREVICQAVALALPPAFQRLESTDPSAQLKDPPSKLNAYQVSFLLIAPVAVKSGQRRPQGRRSEPRPEEVVAGKVVGVDDPGVEHQKEQRDGRHDQRGQSSRHVLLGER